jgi:phage anti-repressor protein
MIGFAHKKNAKRTLENNFIKGEDYIINVLPRETIRTGPDSETIMLNVDTFKNLCMMAKTDKGKEIRKYYVKLENIFNRIANEERLEYEVKVKELESINQAQKQTLEVLTKKTNKYKLGQSVYIFKSMFEGKHIYKLGKTKNANDRESTHKTSSFEGLVLQ